MLKRDRYRQSGPETSILPLKPPTKTDPSNLIQNANEIRPLFSRIGINPSASGSAYLEMGKLKVMAVVYGPKSNTTSTPLHPLEIDFKFAPFSCQKRRGHVKDSQEKEFSLIIQQALYPAIRHHLYSQSNIQVYIQVLESDGIYASLAAGINCASMALADAGVEMLDTVIACASVILFYSYQ